MSCCHPQCSTTWNSSTARPHSLVFSHCSQCSFDGHDTSMHVAITRQGGTCAELTEGPSGTSSEGSKGAEDSSYTPVSPASCYCQITQKSAYSVGWQQCPAIILGVCLPVTVQMSMLSSVTRRFIAPAFHEPMPMNVKLRRCYSNRARHKHSDVAVELGLHHMTFYIQHYLAYKLQDTFMLHMAASIW